MRSCTVQPLPPRGVPLRLWRATVSEFYFEDELGIRRLPWGEATEVDVRSDGGKVVLHYTAPNEVWMRTATLEPKDVAGRRVTYRARLLPFLTPRVVVRA